MHDVPCYFFVVVDPSVLPKVDFLRERGIKGNQKPISFGYNKKNHIRHKIGAFNFYNAPNWTHLKKCTIL